MLTHTHTHTCLTALFPGLPRWAGTRKVKPIWILLKQETVSGSGISWAICKSASHSRQITTPAPHHSSFLQAGCPSCRPINSIKALKATNHACWLSFNFWNKFACPMDLYAGDYVWYMLWYLWFPANWNVLFLWEVHVHRAAGQHLWDLSPLFVHKWSHANVAFVTNIFHTLVCVDIWKSKHMICRFLSKRALCVCSILMMAAVMNHDAYWCMHLDSSSCSQRVCSLTQTTTTCAADKCHFSGCQFLIGFLPLSSLIVSLLSKHKTSCNLSNL